MSSSSASYPQDFSDDKVSWTSFAKYFDLSARNNPAYQDLIANARETFSKLPLGDGPISDVGAGTGNFSIMLSRLYPDREVLHVEPDREMIGQAMEKAEGCSNLRFIQEPAEDLEATGHKWSAAISIHALYAMSDPKKALLNIYNNLNPGGFLFLCDLGKKHNSLDWAKYFFVSKFKSDGFFAAVKLMRDLAGLEKETQKITSQQVAGSSWTHNLATLSSLCAELGFEVLESRVVYRGYSNLLLCQKPGAA